MDIFKLCPILENDRFIARLFKNEDCDDLLKVYSDKNALPFFNSDNCDGDNFYYCTKDKMSSAIGFWTMAYDNDWFVRLSIIDKTSNIVIGTIELCKRVSDDEFDNMGILRVDLRSDYEQEDELVGIFSLVAPKMEELLGCKGVVTKAPIYAVDRIEALKKVGFNKSEDLLIGKDGYLYNGYWTMK